ncbi:RES family NAD+ phosphorylase [Nonomuraea sp. NPDC048901]|uniref:RES family NAD+ phosphorylase n=1 Tax=Nonomuraea sp. NPDC048901 TaxID=3155627 RepID=UPI0033D7E0B7
MPNRKPPTGFRATPHLLVLPLRSRLWRVHGQQYKSTDFNSRPADDNFGGGRFDGTDRDPYPYFYAGLEAGTALAETLLRSIPYNEKGNRKIPRASVRGRRASVVETTQALTLVDLCSEEALAAVAQDTWLTQADPDDYHATRRWASWIRCQASAAHGLIWPSRRLSARPALVLFGDRCPDGCLVADPAAGGDLDDLEGAIWVNRFLAPYRASVDKPRRRTTT